MWILIFLGGWLAASLVVSPVIGHFIVAHLKINEDAETRKTSAGDVGLGRQPASIAIMEQGKAEARLTLN